VDLGAFGKPLEDEPAGVVEVVRDEGMDAPFASRAAATFSMRSRSAGSAWTFSVVMVAVWVITLVPFISRSYRVEYLTMKLF
jgi:hypothetical protein